MLGNWEIAPIHTYQSGEWGTVQSGVDSNLKGDSAPDRAIWNASGVPGTGSAVVPLCTSAVPVGQCTIANIFNVANNVVAYKATTPTLDTFRRITAHWRTLAETRCYFRQSTTSMQPR